MSVKELLSNAEIVIGEEELTEKLSKGKTLIFPEISENFPHHMGGERIFETKIWGRLPSIPPSPQRLLCTKVNLALR